MLPFHPTHTFGRLRCSARAVLQPYFGTSAGCLLVPEAHATMLPATLYALYDAQEIQGVVDMRHQPPGVGHLAKHLQRLLNQRQGFTPGGWTALLPPGKFVLYYGNGDTLYSKYAATQLDSMLQHLAEEGCATKKTLAVITGSPSLLQRLGQINEGEKFQIIE